MTNAERDAEIASARLLCDDLNTALTRIGEAGVNIKITTRQFSFIGRPQIELVELKFTEIKEL